MAIRPIVFRKQAYFAIAVNDDGTMYIDHDISINYDENLIWNEATEEWESEFDHSEFYEGANEKLGDLLRNNTLETIWLGIDK